jgi:DNA-binding HxlR family transcriptional regulator
MYEYKVISAITSEALERQLNQLAMDGWRVAHVIALHPVGVFLEREVEPEANPMGASR